MRAVFFNSRSLLASSRSRNVCVANAMPTTIAATSRTPKNARDRIGRCGRVTIVKDPPIVRDGRHCYCRFAVVSLEPPTQQYRLHAAVGVTLGNLVTETLDSLDLHQFTARGMSVVGFGRVKRLGRSI